MLPALACLVIATEAPQFAPPYLWAAGFAAPPRIPLLGDVDGDGLADLICVYPPGDAIIDVSLNQKGQKPGVPFQALTKWGKDCQAATAGEFDDKPGVDVAGIFAGDTIRLAHGFEGGKFKDHADWVKLPQRLESPKLSSSAGKLVAFSSKTGDGFSIDIKTKQIKPERLPKGMVQKLTPKETLAMGVFENGQVAKLNFSGQGWRRDKMLGSLPPGARTAARSDWVLTDGSLNDLRNKTPYTADQPSHFLLGDIDGDGDEDLVEYRYGKERHLAFDILVYRCISPGEIDSDSDGLTNEEEARLGTDPFNPDTDGDGLLDGWEVNGFRDLDLPKMGCNPRRLDVVALISRFATVDEAHVKREMDRVLKFYKDLDIENHDGSKGITLHLHYLPPVEEADQKNPWWQNRDKFRPANWKGLVHWMQITPGGGGQADQMGDGGTCGANALWAVFIHEFGHQLGMGHDGFWETGLCPIYPSLMSYAYSYSFEDDGNRIHYSKGLLKDYVLNETRLDETIPLPYEKVKFLEKGPYRFRLKQNGDTTLIDWNWNGIFGEKNIRADINYSYSTNAGHRDEIGKIMSSPYLFVHKGSAYAVFGQHDFPGDTNSDPTISPEKPGVLKVRRLIEPLKWEPAVTIDSGLIGDPVGFSQGGKLYVVYPTRQGVLLRSVEQRGGRTTIEQPMVVSADPALTPTVGEYGGRTFIFLWKANGSVVYRIFDGRTLAPEKPFLHHSTIPVGMAVDTIRDEIVIGMAQDQDAKRPSRWQIRRFKLSGNDLIEREMQWIEGRDGQSRGYGRCMVLFDSSPEAGPDGRIYFFGRGLTSKENPWACTYVAHEIADKTVRGGWLVKRYYDEWTQTRSAPAAAWFQGDVIWAYRWVDASQGDRDNLFHVGYKALGIQDVDMGDHDDLAFLKDLGIRRSILWLGRE